VELVLLFLAVLDCSQLQRLVANFAYIMNRHDHAGVPTKYLRH